MAKSRSAPEPNKKAKRPTPARPALTLDQQQEALTKALTTLREGNTRQRVERLKSEVMDELRSQITSAHRDPQRVSELQDVYDSLHGTIPGFTTDVPPTPRPEPEYTYGGYSDLEGEEE